MSRQIPKSVSPASSWSSRWAKCPPSWRVRQPPTVPYRPHRLPKPSFRDPPPWRPPSQETPASSAPPTAAVEVVPEDCTLAYTGDTLVEPLAQARLTAQFGESDAFPGSWTGKLITFEVVDTLLRRHLHGYYQSSRDGVRRRASER